MRRTGKAIGTLAAATSLAMVGGGLALADTVDNDVVSTAGQTVRSVAAGSSTVISYTVTNTNTNTNQAPYVDTQASCNPADKTPLQVGMTGLPTGVTLTSPEIEACGAPIGFTLAVAAATTPGDYIIGHTFSDAGGGVYYDLAGFTLRVTAPVVSKKSQTITFDAPASAAYGDQFTVGPTASSSLPVALAATGGCVASGLAITMTSSAADCVPTASQAGNSEYSAATSVVDRVSATTRAITVTAADKSKTYGEVDPALTYAVTSGSLVSSSHLSGSLTRQVGEDFGDYRILQGTVAATADYALTFVAGTLSVAKRTVAVTAHAARKKYGDADPALTYTAPALLAGDSFVGALTRAQGEDVGTWAITQGTLSAGNNYGISFTGANLTIDVKQVTVRANPQSKTYGDADPELTYAQTGLAFSDAFSGELTRNAGQDVGSYAIEQGTLTASSNYAITFIGNSLTVGQKLLTVTADAQSKTYGDPDPVLSYTHTGLAYMDTFSGQLTRDAGQDVGSYAIRQGTLTAGSNYGLTFVGANLTVGTRTLTGTFTAADKAYDGTTAASGERGFTNVVAGDDVALSGGTASFADRNAGTGKTVTLTGAALTGSATGNYTLAATSITDTADIAPVALSVAADNKSKYFNASDPELTYQVTSGSLVAGDTWSGALSRDTGEAVGRYDITQGTLTAGPNYTVAFTKGVLTIGAWDFRGFQQPVDVSPTATPVYNTVKGGSTVPFKFEIFSGTTEQTATTAVKPLLSAVQLCAAQGSEDAVEFTATGGTTLRYDTSAGQYVYNWQTPKTAGQCYKVTIASLDGSSKTAYFKTK